MGEGPRVIDGRLRQSWERQAVAGPDPEAKLWHIEASHPNLEDKEPSPHPATRPQEALRFPTPCPQRW